MDDDDDEKPVFSDMEGDECESTSFLNSLYLRQRDYVFGSICLYVC